MKAKSLLLFLFATFNTIIHAQNPALVGYWHNWNVASAPYIPLDQVDTRYNTIHVSFGVPQAGTNSTIVFVPDGVTQATLIAQIQTVHSQGRKVVLSLGGATAPISMSNATERNAFISSVTNIVNTYGFDGIDIDFEGSSLSVSGGTIAAPIDQPVINLIAGIKQIMVNYRASKGSKMFLSMAPETAFVQGGMSSYGGIWGAYLPVIHALRDSIDILQVQLYNSGSMYGINGSIYTQGTADFIVSQTEAVIKGFNTAGGAFVGLPANKIAVGLPACTSAAGSGYTTPANVKAAINYLRGTGAKPGTYTLAQVGGYPDLRGMMTWSINWDKVSTCGPAYEYAQNFQTIFGGGVITNIAPSVTITSPVNNASFATPTSIAINATATDSDGTIAKVDFYRGTTLLFSDNTAPYSYTWVGAAIGTYSLTAKATDNSGAVTTSAAVTVVVKKTNTVPSVSITSPTNSASFSMPASITINATAADTDGTITKVDFYRGTTLLFSDNTAPYSLTWTGAAAGTYSLTAKATDNSGGITTSTAVSVVVKATNTAPSVSITSPVNNVPFNAPASVTINATAADTDGTITKVDFYNGATLLNSDNAAPYSFIWANVAAGTYTLTAKATDNSGSVTTSAAVTIVVNAVTTTADIIGADCASINTVAVYDLSAANKVNITTVSWWFGGSVLSIDTVAGQVGRATVNFGPSFAGGNLCVGVNYSAAPWYKQICKTVSLCPVARAVSNVSKSGVVSPNPSGMTFNFTASQNINSAKIFDQLGNEKINLGVIQNNQSIQFGEQLSSGIYFLTVQYEDKSIEMMKLIKVK
jgi:chitinase